MAYPIVQFDSSSGSDSLASGAGPATAINSTTEGTTAATDVAGTFVTFSGATDLSGVATDGINFAEDQTQANITVLAAAGVGTGSIQSGD
jgi:hypothetical protein